MKDESNDLDDDILWLAYGNHPRNRANARRGKRIMVFLRNHPERTKEEICRHLEILGEGETAGDMRVHCQFYRIIGPLQGNNLRGVRFIASARSGVGGKHVYFLDPHGFNATVQNMVKRIRNQLTPHT